VLVVTPIAIQVGPTVRVIRHGIQGGSAGKRRSVAGVAGALALTHQLALLFHCWVGQLPIGPGPRQPRGAKQVSAAL